MYSHIIDPHTNQKVNIYSNSGKEVLNNYLKFVTDQKGGGIFNNTSGDNVIEPTRQELPCFIINLPVKRGPIVNYFNSWITDDKKVIIECQIIIEQILLALWGRNKPLIERSGKIVETVSDFNKKIKTLLDSLQDKNINIIESIASIKNLISKLDSILPDKKIIESRFITKLLSALEELSTSQKDLNDANKTLSLEADARNNAGFSADTEIEGTKSKILEAGVELAKKLEIIKNLKNEEFSDFNDFLSKISQASNRSKTTMLRKINFDNIRGLRVVRTNSKQLVLMGSNILYSDSSSLRKTSATGGGISRRIQIDIRIVNDYMLSAKLSSLESGKPIKLKISSIHPKLDHKTNITNEELKDIDGVLLLSIPRSIVLTDISHNTNTQSMDSSTFLKNVELAVAHPRPEGDTSNRFIQDIVEKLFTSRSRKANYKRFLNYILEAILTKKNREEYYVHNIEPFFDVRQKKIVSYGDKNINKSFVLEISNFNKIAKGYSLQLKLHELIPKFKKGRSLEYYRGLPYYDFGKVLTEIASINLENVDGEIVPSYIFTGSSSFFDMCSIM